MDLLITESPCLPSSPGIPALPYKARVYKLTSYKVDL